MLCYNINYLDFNLTMCVGAVRLSSGFLCVMTIAQITRERKNHACICHQRHNAYAEVGLTPYNFREQTIVKMDRTGVKTITVPIGGKKPAYKALVFMIASTPMI